MPKSKLLLLLLSLILSLAAAHATVLGSDSKPVRNQEQKEKPKSGYEHAKDEDYDRDDDDDDDDRRCQAEGDRKESGRQATFAIPLPGIQYSVWEDGTVSLAIPLRNTTERVVRDVSITQLNVIGAKRLEPTLPLKLGDVVPNDTRVLNASVRVPALGAENQYPVVLRGAYRHRERSCRFRAIAIVTPLPRFEGPVQASPGIGVKLSAKAAVYPPIPKREKDREFNAEFLPLTPIGPKRNFFTKPPSHTLLQEARLLRPDRNFRPPAANDLPANSVVFTRNTLGATYGGFPPDPSVAGEDNSGVVMFTANTAVSYSVDGGASFKTVNLVSGFNDPSNPARNAFFPEDDGGLCCDQVVTYIPGRNIYVWLLQYWPQKININLGFIQFSTTLQNRLRIAWASPEAIKADFIHAWTWVDLTSAGMGIGIDWMDYPDLAFSDNFVYVGVDHGIQGTGQVYTDKHLFARLSLNDIVNPAIPVVNYQYMEPSRGNIYQNHIVQSGRDIFFWSALPDTSTISLYSWPDWSNSAIVKDISISSYNNTDFTVTAPDKPDWNTAPKNALGATRVDPSLFCPPEGCQGATHYLYFAFSAGRNTSANRPFPYVRVEKIDPDHFTRLDEVDIWNASFAFSTPALVSRPNSGRDEVALSLALGGGGSYANNAVGFLGDFVVYTTTDSDTTQAVYNRDKNNNIINDSSGNPTFFTRFGDYYSVRNSVGPITANGRGVGYSTLGYAVKTNKAGQACFQVGCFIQLHYVQFGRAGDLFPLSPPPPPR